MAEPYLSTLWYRVAKLTPRLRPHLRVARHRYRGRAWYVVHDLASGRIHRFTPAAWMLIGQLDGTRTVDAVWKGIAATHDEEAPSQTEVIRLLSQLHQQDLILYSGTPDLADLLDRYNRQATQVIRQNLTNPMSFRLPLWDPDRFLTAATPFVRWMTGWWGLVLWAVLVAAGLATAALNWGRLTTDLAGQLLSTQNIAIMLVTYPLLKALHELAHGFLAKARGLEVREMGIMFLVFFPVPYVDASAAAALPNKWHRAAVAAGGIFVETAVAAAAVIVWANAETGFTAAIAYSLVMIGGLSTLVVNGNPLLKFDGYFVMSDLVEIPNLAQRANKFWGHLAERYAFGAREVKEEIATWGERVWFVLYAPAAYVYRIVIMVGIAWYLAQSYFVLGLLLACWTVFQSVVKPVLKHMRHVVIAPKLRKVRRRAVAMTYGGAAAILLALALVPLPLHTTSTGIVWLPDEAQLRARTSGFVVAVEAARGAKVAAGTVVLRLDDPTLSARIAGLEARVDEFRRRLAIAEVRDRAEIAVARASLDETRAELARERRRQDDLAVVAPVAGRFEPAAAPDSLVGRFVSEGDALGSVLPPRPDRMRVVVAQDDVDLVRGRVDAVAVRLEGRLDQAHPSDILRAVPAATDRLPAPALGQPAGGRWLIDPTDRDGLRTLARVFVYDLALPDGLADAPYGTRVLVRFEHGHEPALSQAWRRLSQLFLRLLNT
ncbi:MAG TPA: peptidase M50 [Paracoccaceae bacterium]|nr:peptidase M50 [Paracoccaceae bacterium]